MFTFTSAHRHIFWRQVRNAGTKFQVTGAILQVSGARFEVPKTSQPGTMCQVSEIRRHIKMSKTFTLKILYVLTEIKNLFYVSNENKLTNTFFITLIFSFMPMSKLFIANSKIKARLRKIRKTQPSAVQLYQTCRLKP